MIERLYTKPKHAFYDHWHFFRISSLLSNNMEKYVTAREATDDNVTQHMHIAAG